MYHAQRYSNAAWPGEPEVDPMQEYEEREQVEGWELSPLECLESAYGGVLRERAVVAGKQHACHSCWACFDRMLVQGPAQRASLRLTLRMGYYELQSKHSPFHCHHLILTMPPPALGTVAFS